MFVGIDFGTSNSSAAVYNGKEIVYIPLDPFNPEDIHVLSSMLYLSRTGERLVGHKAITEYIEQMAGRIIKLERKAYGDVEMTFGDMTYIAKGFYLDEKNIPGRLFQYLKKYMGSNFRTNVFGTLYKPYELVALILKYMKTTTEHYLRQDVDGVVLGRPVRFADEEAKNRDAARHLRMACQLAGFKTVEFQYEPVAAASNYALTANDNENILIFDFGGGTFDVTVVNVQTKKAKVLGLAGVPVGGSDFDKAIMYDKITPHFGRGCYVDAEHLVHDTLYLDLLN